MLRKLLCVKYLGRHVIDNHSRDFQTSNCATVSVKPGRATRSKRQLLNFLKANGKSELPSSSLTSGAVLPQRKGKCKQANWHYTERCALNREGLSNLVLSVLNQVLTLWLRRSVDWTALAATTQLSSPHWCTLVGTSSWISPLTTRRWVPSRGCYKYTKHLLF